MIKPALIPAFLLLRRNINVERLGGTSFYFQDLISPPRSSIEYGETQAGRWFQRIFFISSQAQPAKPLYIYANT